MSFTFFMSIPSVTVGESSYHQGTETGVGDRPRRRFSTFQFRKRNIFRSASGPTLTVVDADRTHVIQVE